MWPSCQLSILNMWQGQSFYHCLRWNLDAHARLGGRRRSKDRQKQPWYYNSLQSGPPGQGQAAHEGHKMRQTSRSYHPHPKGPFSPLRPVLHSHSLITLVITYLREYVGMHSHSSQSEPTWLNLSS